MEKNIILIQKMIEYYRNDPKRIQHFIKVHSFANIIGRLEGLDDRTQFILETATIVHDIGIKPSEIKYGNCTGKNQEKEGVEPAANMLSELGYDDDITERVCFLVAHHHTYSGIDGIDWQILIEADFIVNSFEDNLTHDALISVYNKIFKTKSGKNIFREMFLSDDIL